MNLPPEVLALADTLQVLDVSDNALTSLPEGLAACSRLHTLFASSNRFTQLPPVLGRLPALDTLGFKANQIAQVPAEALAPTLRWLILTDNRVAELPATLTRCTRLQKLMLAGNRLTRLPAGLEALQRLELIRLSANLFARVADALPLALLGLPRLAWLAHGGNPYALAAEAQAARADATPHIAWPRLQLQGLLGEGASGHIHAALLATEGATQAVAVKLFKGAVTSDGLPASEMAASIAAGSHPHLVGELGQIDGHPDGRLGLVMRRVPPQCRALAGPPSMHSCSRDVYAPGLRLPARRAEAIARAVASALGHLHARGLAHGDLYAHNILVDEGQACLLSDLGAASFLPADDAARAEALRALDWRAHRVLVDELAERCDAPQALAAWRG
ncbi:leucine-rich repeat-containing protein kinase family protein [Aquabacterium sp. OR-4]|uniref:leucine-rich repeat-containing protein kinase family protein n=1 Tax=Aquabacterium sp. OR-4 TaxID=2978127 RepID=UPI0028C6693E|nr:leucine-rich repeat-containing protein kinase family protein [Aquabacterium sp. OR-4]MDT7837956.1 leucine-rich repeat-containing protein kinase family protein [Aquabacterium sp. OR-4]